MRKSATRSKQSAQEQTGPLTDRATARGAGSCGIWVNFFNYFWVIFYNCFLKCLRFGNFKIFQERTTKSPHRECWNPPAFNHPRLQSLAPVRSPSPPLKQQSAGLTSLNHWSIIWKVMSWDAQLHLHKRMLNSCSDNLDAWFQLMFSTFSDTAHQLIGRNSSF